MINKILFKFSVLEMSVCVLMPTGETASFPIEGNGITGIQLKRAVAKRLSDNGVETCHNHLFLSKTSGLVGDKDTLSSGQDVSATIRANGGCECRCNIL